MLRNYLKIALRNIAKNKLYSFINIAGLSIGFAASVIIGLYLRDELSYDRFHDKAENIYRISWFSQDPQTRTPHPLAQAIARDFEEVKSAVSMTPIYGPGLTKQVFTIKRPDEENWYEESDVLGVDSTFFNVFSFRLVAGNRSEVLRKPGGILLSETASQKYFGEEEPIGKLIMINNDSTLLQVEGVFEDVPANSHFHFNALVSYVTLKSMTDPDSEFYTWRDFGHFNYIRLYDKADPNLLESKMMRWAANYLDWDEEMLERLETVNAHFKLQPMVDIHLRSSIRWELEPNGNIGYVYIMTAAAIFILVIASFNFMNLTTARAVERAGEIGIRKAMGAARANLRSQFLGESLLMSLLAILLAGLLTEVSLPFFNTFTGKELSLNTADPNTWIILLSASIAIGLLSGLYPAVFLSSLQSIQILKGKYASSSGGKAVRKLLVVLQFGISMFLIAGFAVINQQLRYLNNKDLGFKRESVIIVPIKTEEIRQRFEALQSGIKNIKGVVSISAASNVPSKDFNQNPIWSDLDPDVVVSVQQMMVDYDIFETLGLELVDGRTFSRENPVDYFNNFVLNQRAVQALELEEPVGKSLTFDMDGTTARGQIIGVVKDFNFQSLHQPIRPLVFQLIRAYNYGLIRVSMRDFDQTVQGIQQVWNQFDGNFDFEYDFLDEMLTQQYVKEKKMGTVFGLFAVLAIIIACLGLAAIAAIDFANRRKEIGIRKVLGAPNVKLTFNLLKEYTVVVAIALVLALPLWWLIMQNWLNNFNFRVALDPMAFLVSGITLVVISWSTLSYLTYKTVNANPVEAIQEE